jgi:HK97 family phage prohead protease
MKKRHTNKNVSTLERRYLRAGDLRAAKNSKGGDMIAGYATKFTPALSDDLGGFFECIDPHAFDECLASNPDVRGLWNHDANHVLGRTIAGTLRLSVDSTGLAYEIDPPATNMAKDLMISMDRGDVTQSSFGFYCIDDTWEDRNGKVIRTVLKADLFDVSPVTYPAYPDATAGVRDLALRSAPANIKAKLASLTRDAVDDILAEPDDSDDDDTCGDDCPECLAGDCQNCSNEDCDDEHCADCPEQTRAANLALLALRRR